MNRASHAFYCGRRAGTREESVAMWKLSPHRKDDFWWSRPRDSERRVNLPRASSCCCSSALQGSGSRGATATPTMAARQPPNGIVPALGARSGAVAAGAQHVAVRLHVARQSP